MLRRKADSFAKGGIDLGFVQRGGAISRRIQATSFDFYSKVSEKYPPRVRVKVGEHDVRMSRAHAG